MPVIAHLNHHLGFFTKADYAKVWELYMDIDALVCRDIDEMFCAFMWERNGFSLPVNAACVNMNLAILIVTMLILFVTHALFEKACIGLPSNSIFIVFIE